MSERLLSLLSDGGGSPSEKLRALGQEVQESVGATFLEIRIQGIGEVRFGERGQDVERMTIGPTSQPLGEISISPAPSADLSPFIRCAEVIHRLQAGYVDGLTGLYNRRRLDLELGSLGLSVDSAAIVMMDIDHFKRVNDTYGHDAGDAVLRKFASRLLEAMPAGGFLARYGGEEFCVILPDASEEAGAEEAERLRFEASSDPILHGHQEIRFTSSAGVAAGDANHPDQLMARADEALYAAKESGRNLVVRSSEILRRNASRLLKRRFRRVLNHPLYDLAWCGQRVIGLERQSSRLAHVDYFGGVMSIGGEIPGAISFVRSRHTTVWVQSGRKGIRVERREVPAWSETFPELRRIHYDSRLGRFFLIERQGASLFWTDFDFSHPRQVDLPDRDARGITAVLPLGRSLLVLDALCREILILDRARLTLKEIWPLKDEAYEICLCYVPSLKLILLGGADGVKFLSFNGAVEEQSSQPVISAYAHPLVGLVLSTPDETFLVR